MSKMTFESWVRHNEDRASLTLAKEALTRYPGVVLKIVADRIDDLRRSTVRETIERPAFASTATQQFLGRVSAGASGVAKKLARNDFILPKDLDELRKAVVKLGDGTRVSWGKMTENQHKQRIAMMNTMITGNIETRNRHEQAIGLLRAAGAKCLDELAG